MPFGRKGKAFPHSKRQSRTPQPLVRSVIWTSLGLALLPRRREALGRRGDGKPSPYKLVVLVTALGWVHTSGLISMPKPGNSGTRTAPSAGISGLASMAGQVDS